MFIGRGIRQNKPIITSSLIFVVSRSTPPKAHEIEVMNHEIEEEDIEKCLHSILIGENVVKKTVSQRVLLENVANWNQIIRLGPDFSFFYEEYKKRSDNISIYYDHKIADQYFNSRFYFDVGFVLNKKYAKARTTGSDLELVDFNGFRGFSKYIPSSYYPNDKSKIKLPKNSQGYATLSQKYKIIWSKVYSKKFHFTDRQVVPSMSNAQMICSNNKEELLYLFSLLNSSLNKYVFEKLFQLENEQYGTFLVIKRIKEFLRVPKIMKTNQVVKDEIMRCTVEMLDVEEKTLSDFVDFSGILVQKFEDMQIEGSNLVLVHDGQKMELPIKEQTKLVANSIAEQLGGQQSAQEKRHVSLHELRNLPIVDYERQNRLKAYIDDLVFALYFGIPLQALGLKNATAIRKACLANQHYEYVSKGWYLCPLLRAALTYRQNVQGIK